MATATPIQYFEVVSHPTLNPGSYIRVLSEPVPAWVRHSAKPHRGPLPEDAGKPFDVDPAAEQLQIAEAAKAFQQPKDALLTDAGLRDYMRWTESDLETARTGGYDFPRVESWINTTGNLLEIGTPARRKSAIDKWVLAQREKIAILSRLVNGNAKQ